MLRSYHKGHQGHKGESLYVCSFVSLVSFVLAAQGAGSHAEAGSV
jgi:hypothetical protein